MMFYDALWCSLMLYDVLWCSMSKEHSWFPFVVAYLRSFSGHTSQLSGSQHNSQLAHKSKTPLLVSSHSWVQNWLSKGTKWLPQLKHLWIITMATLSLNCPFLEWLQELKTMTIFCNFSFSRWAQRGNIVTMNFGFAEISWCQSIWDRALKVNMPSSHTDTYITVTTFCVYTRPSLVQIHRQCIPSRCLCCVYAVSALLSPVWTVFYRKISKAKKANTRIQRHTHIDIDLTSLPVFDAFLLHNTFAHPKGNKSLCAF